MQISRSIEIDVPAEKVFESITNFKEWPRWSPWLIAEPSCRVVHALDGQSYSWDGDYIGSGEMAIAKTEKNKALHCDLMFFRPWKSRARVSMLLAPADQGTRLTWIMDSSLPFFMFFFKDMMESFIGLDYERGLSMLKDLLETGEVPVKLEFADGKAGPVSMLGKNTQCSFEEMPEAMKKDLAAVKEWLEESEFEHAEKMMTVYHKWDVRNRQVDYTVGCPVSRMPDELPDDFVSLDIPEVDVFTSQLTGPYRHLGNAWSAGIIRSRNGAFKQSRKVHPFEIYENDPSETDENDLVTTVHFPKR